MDRYVLRLFAGMGPLLLSFLFIQCTSEIPISDNDTDTTTSTHQIPTDTSTHQISTDNTVGTDTFSPDLMDTDSEAENCVILGAPNQSQPIRPGFISIDGVGDFSFEPNLITTTRPDLFQPGYFSVFDVLVHLSQQGEFEMIYHFDEALDTHVIDDLAGQSTFWFHASFDGGFVEDEHPNNRMDYFPVKDKMNIQLYLVSQPYIDQLHQIWRNEVQLRITNNGNVVIPLVVIQNSNYEIYNFTNVPVVPFNLRTDFFVEGTITVLDVIASMKANHLINGCLFKFYESIGTAQVVQNYFVNQINHDLCVQDQAGFLYWAGSNFNLPEIRMATDIHILHSPEQVFFYWTDVTVVQKHH